MIADTAKNPALSAYRIERALSPDGSLLALGPGQKLVVLKPLDPDCLFEGQLHPQVHDRLSRIRELAHLGVAQLYGVERNGESAYLAWQWIDGTPLEELLDSSVADARTLASIAHRLVLSVELLHSLGIVHGAIHPRNIIVTATGE